MKLARFVFGFVFVICTVFFGLSIYLTVKVAWQMFFVALLVSGISGFVGRLCQAWIQNVDKLDWRDLKLSAIYGWPGFLGVLIQEFKPEESD